MGLFYDLMGRYDAETQAFSAFAGTPNSPYRPKVTGKLIGLRVIIGASAATTLTEGVRIKLTCTKWVPNAIEIVVNGTGLRTVPASKAPVFDFMIDQPVDTNHDITLEGMCVEATHVTNSIYVLGLFNGA